MTYLSRQRNLFLLMALATICCGFLVMIRICWQRYQLPDINTFREFVQARGLTFFFLLWNLALAWVPYLMALHIGQLQRQEAGRWRLLLGLCVWLAFLPNAPYLITDFVHFRPLPPVPIWFDLILLFAAASTGLLLGLLSIYEVHQVLKNWFSKRYSNLLILAAIGLSGFGIWLGRFQRWNSWDILTRPLDLLSDIADTFTTRHELLHALGISGLLSGVLLMGYGILTTLMSGQTSRK
mgnify:CR=1 FL=1